MIFALAVSFFILKQCFNTTKIILLHFMYIDCNYVGILFLNGKERKKSYLILGMYLLMCHVCTGTGVWAYEYTNDVPNASNDDLIPQTTIAFVFICFRLPDHSNKCWQTQLTDVTASSPFIVNIFIGCGNDDWTT